MDREMLVFIGSIAVILILLIRMIRINRRLVVSQERYRGLVEATSEWIWEVDSQGRYTYASPMVESFLGYKPEEVIGRTPFDFMPPEEAQRVGEIFTDIMAEKRAFRGVDNINLHKRGWQVVLETSAVPILGSMGELLGYRGVDRDITERTHTEQMQGEYHKQLEEQVSSRTAELRDSKNQLDSIIENLPAIFYIKDANGLYLRVNRSFEAATGMDRSEVIGKRDEELLFESMADLFSAEDGPVFTSITPHTYETAVLHPDNTPHDYLTTKLPHFDSNGDVSGLIGISTDISMVKRLQRDLDAAMDRLKRRAALEQLVSSITSRMIGVEPAVLGIEIEQSLSKIGKFTEADRCYLIQLDGAGEQLSITHQWCAAGVNSTTPCFQAVPRSAHLYMMEMLEYGMALDVKDVDRLPPDADSLKVLMQAGSTRATLMLPVIYGGYLRGVIGLDSLMVKSGWNAEDLDLLKTQAVLLGQVLHSHEYQDALRASRDEAERLARVKSEFLANMSHEIRTPLNAVLGLAQIGVRDSFGRKHLKNFQHILDSGQHLLGLVNDILDFSKFEAGKFVPERVLFNFGEVIDRALSFVIDRASAREIELEVREPNRLPASIEGDPLRLTQVLSNLLGNALKFTERGRMVLHVAIEEETLVIRVEDTGIGMSTEQISRLFTPFEQADSSITRRFGGSGLGLAISERLVRAMGGTIVVQSEVGVGTVFEVRLPLLNPVYRQQQTVGDKVVLHLLEPGEKELADISAWATANEMEVKLLAVSELTEMPVDGVLLLTDRLLKREQVLATLVRLLDQGGRVVLLSPSDVMSQLPEEIRSRIMVLEQPLRLRHLLRGIFPELEPKGECGRARLEGLRILAAEDTEVNRIILQDLLEREAAEVVFAENGQQAVERLMAEEHRPFDLVLMDVQMPVMDGYEATRQLRKLKPQLPVIGLTAHAFAEDKARCHLAGMVSHVSKPIDVETLVTAILKYAPTQRRESAIEITDATNVSVIPLQVRHGDEAGLVEWGAFYERYSGRQPLINRLLTSVCSNYQETPDELRQAVANKDFERIAFLAHSVKGTAGNLLANTLFDLATLTEMSARNEVFESFSQALELADLLVKLLELVADKLETWKDLKRGG